ncbi:ABC transporter permease [Xanthobacter sp. DSM 24535]|uniref:ABC transporter permease n=1 Tax=Roseixanthobacter psychrophilus TaxID=3119917 RepID=UPI003728682F
MAAPTARSLGPGAAHPRARLTRILKAVGNRLGHLVLIPILLLAWEASVRLGFVSATIFPPPSAVFKALIDLAEAGLLWADIRASVLRVAVGFSLATLSGIALGLLFAMNRRVALYFLPLIELLRPISVIAWIPLAILWFGLGDRSAWFIIFIGAFFPIFTNAFLGACSVAPIHVQVSQCFGAGRWLFLSRVMLPTALPYIVAGLRIGLGVAWTCVIAAELIAATSGLGYMIQLARSMIETEKVMAGMIVIGAVGFLMNTLMLWLEHALIGWKTQH